MEKGRTKTPSRIRPEDYIRREVIDDTICLLIFDRKDSGANIFDEAAFDALNHHLDWIEKNNRLEGLVIASAKDNIFIAGADLNTLSKCTFSGDAKGLTEMIRTGQETFQRIATLSLPSVAAIHGACLGGGLELALACQYRIASNHKSTKIGLPETQLGIIPGWGGSTRLPKLIGLPKALSFILSGKILSVEQAYRSGIVDDRVFREHLLDYTVKWIHEKRWRNVRRKNHWLTNNPLAAYAIAATTRPKLIKKTRGRYPAITRAMEVVCGAAYSGIRQGLRAELAAITDLAMGKVSQNLVRIFFMREDAKKRKCRGSENIPRTDKKRVAVIGAGVMGAGIAQWLTARGWNVFLKDIEEKAVARGIARVRELYQAGVKRRKFTKLEALTALNRLYPGVNNVAFQNLDFVIEAAVERMDLKKAIFTDLDQSVDPGTILATNTSALSITELAKDLKHPERVVGIHFFNPVHRMELVEIIVGEQTSTEAVNRSLRLVQAVGKLPVVVKDSPGFVVNRILVPYLLEAGHLFESGIPAQDIDGAMLRFGMPMGPLRLIDEVGIDVAEHVGDTLVAAYGDRMKMPSILPWMGKKEFYGKKAGKGFYLYQGGKAGAPNSALLAHARSHPSSPITPEDVEKRMVFMMINEAARCLEEKIVEQAADIDFAMIMGTGFAPFRGGPLRYADSIGLVNLRDGMRALADQAGEAYAPCALINQLAEQQQTFYDS